MTFLDRRTADLLVSLDADDSITDYDIVGRH